MKLNLSVERKRLLIRSNGFLQQACYWPFFAANEHLICNHLFFIIFYFTLDQGTLAFISLLTVIFSIISSAIVVYIERSLAMEADLKRQKSYSSLFVSHIKVKILPITWLLLCLIIWFIAFPVCMFKRASYADYTKLASLSHTSTWIHRLAKLMTASLSALIVTSLALSLALLSCLFL